MVKKFKDWAISLQGSKELDQGSTTRVSKRETLKTPRVQSGLKSDDIVWPNMKVLEVGIKSPTITAQP